MTWGPDFQYRKQAYYPIPNYMYYKISICNHHPSSSCVVRLDLNRRAGVVSTKHVKLPPSDPLQSFGDKLSAQPELHPQPATMHIYRGCVKRSMKDGEKHFEILASSILCVPKHALITKKQMSKEENKLMLYSGCLDCWSLPAVEKTNNHFVGYTTTSLCRGKRMR